MDSAAPRFSAVGAGAVGAEHGAAFPRANRNGDVGQRRERAEQPRHAAQLQRGAGTDG